MPKMPKREGLERLLELRRMLLDKAVPCGADCGHDRPLHVRLEGWSPADLRGRLGYSRASADAAANHLMHLPKGQRRFCIYADGKYFHYLEVSAEELADVVARVQGVAKPQDEEQPMPPMPPANMEEQLPKTADESVQRLVAGVLGLAEERDEAQRLVAAQRRHIEKLEHALATSQDKLKEMEARAITPETHKRVTDVLDRYHPFRASE